MSQHFTVKGSARLDDTAAAIIAGELGPWLAIVDDFDGFDPGESIGLIPLEDGSWELAADGTFRNLRHLDVAVFRAAAAGQVRGGFSVDCTADGASRTVTAVNGGDIWYGAGGCLNVAVPAGRPELTVIAGGRFTILHVPDDQVTVALAGHPPTWDDCGCAGWDEDTESAECASAGLTAVEGLPAIDVTAYEPGADGATPDTDLTGRVCQLIGAAAAEGLWALADLVADDHGDYDRDVVHAAWLAAFAPASPDCSWTWRSPTRRTHPDELVAVRPIVDADLCGWVPITGPGEHRSAGDVVSGIALDDLAAIADTAAGIDMAAMSAGTLVELHVRAAGPIEGTWTTGP